MGDKIRWFIYVILTALLLYWLSNLILWKIWSMSAVGGMTVMLTLNPLIWGVGEYACLRRFYGGSGWKGAVLVAVIMIGLSVVSDYLFFDLGLHSTDVWHPTTFYGYGFVVVLPFLIRWMFRRRLLEGAKTVSRRDIGWLVGVNAALLFVFFAFVL